MTISLFASHAFTLRQLQYAVAVSESLSFRLAAEQCHVSQPSLSAQIAELEGALGAPLFERDRRRVLLTTFGRDMVERAKRLLREASALRSAALIAKDPLLGTLRIGVIPTISPYFLPRATPALREAYPSLMTVWVEDKTENLMRALDDGALEAALVALEAPLGEVDHAEIARDPFVLATRAGDPLGCRSSPVSPGELRDREVLLLDDGHCLRTQALDYCGAAKLRELEFRATSLTTLTQMVAGGAGVTLLPELALSVEAARAGLQVRRFAKPVPYRTVALVWRRRSALAQVLTRLAATLREAYPKGTPARAATPTRSSSKYRPVKTKKTARSRTGR